MAQRSPVAGLQVEETQLLPYATLQHLAPYDNDAVAKTTWKGMQ